jgi:signal transduction histidine kinase
MICGVWAERGTPASLASAACCEPAGDISARFRRTTLRLALLLRGVPLLQLVLTGALGFDAYRRPGLLIAACCLAVGWSGCLAARIWSTARPGWLVCCGDGAVSAAVLLMVGACVPDRLLTTSFYWPATFAAASVLIIGLSMPLLPGLTWLALLAATYGLVVAHGAGVRALPVAAGNAAGMAVYFGLAAAIARYRRRLAGKLARASQDARQREARLGVRRARLEEFGRLHDEAVQVLEQAARGAPHSAGLRAYAARAAAHLREDSGPEPVPCTLLHALTRVADDFTTLGFPVAVQRATPFEATIGDRSRSLLVSAVVEALNNALKHSGAGGATVRLATAASWVEVTVEDHGRGFDPGAVRPRFGLASSIRRRVEEAGGTVYFWSAPGAGTAVRMWVPSAAWTAVLAPSAGERVSRARVLLALASRAACCLYGVTVTVINLTGYRSPVLAVAATSVALMASATVGLALWRRQAVSGALALVDTALGGVILVLLASAIAPHDRAGSLNWALAYGVSCASWLALGRQWRSGAALAGALGVTYWAGAVGGWPWHDPALTVTALVNAVSPPLYFAIAVAVFAGMRRAAAEIDASQAVENAQQRELAALAERERLVREVHESVLGVLDVITSGSVPGAELRARACAEAMALRRAFSDPDRSGDGDLRTRLVSLARERATAGWVIHVVDDEMEAEPSPAAAAALQCALAELLDGAAPGGDRGVVRVRVLAGREGAELTVRLQDQAQGLAGPFERASAWLADVAGTAELERALAGESRVLLRAPA